MRALSAEGVLSLAPSVVIAVEGSGPTEAIDVLEQASVPFVLVPEAYDAAERRQKDPPHRRRCSASTDKGEAIVADASRRISPRSKRCATAITKRRKAVFVLGMSTAARRSSPGEHTAADGIFALAGVDNALAGDHRLQAGERRGGDGCGAGRGRHHGRARPRADAGGRLRRAGLRRNAGGARPAG